MEEEAHAQMDDGLDGELPDQQRTGRMKWIEC